MRARTSASLSSLALAAVVMTIGAPAHACLSDADCPGLSSCVGVSLGTNGTCSMFPSSLPSGTRTDGAVACGSVGVGVAALSLLIAGIGGANNWTLDAMRRDAHTLRGWEIFLFTTGGVSAALGGLGVGLQSSVSGACPLGSECAASYGVGAGALTGGALLLTWGIYLAATPYGAPRRAWIVPVPVVMPGARGPVVGFALAGADL